MAATRPYETPEYLCAGSMILDVRGHALVGPAGRVVLERGAYVVLKALMAHPGVALSADDLIAAGWPDPDLEPDAAERAVCMRVLRARAAMKEAGLPPKQLRTVRGTGYLVEGTPLVVRAFTPAQADVLDTLLATHPNQAAAAEVRGVSKPERYCERASVDVTMTDNLAVRLEAARRRTAELAA